MIKQSIETLPIHFLKKAQRLFIGLAIISTAITLFFALKNWDRFIESYLVAFVFTLAIPIGCLFLVMIQFLTRAGWGVAVRRIPEVLMHTFLCLAILFLPLLFGLDHLYHWFDPSHRAHDHLLQIKAPYLNSTFFYIRMIFYFLVWIKMTHFFYKHSIKQDSDGEREHTKLMQRKSAPYIFLYALTVSFAAIDLLMSIESHWFSTIFGVYYFSIAILLALSVVSMIYLLFYYKNILEDIVTVEHFHDLGKLIYGFIIFWAYISFSQYFLIWYANIPEETFWFLKRSFGSWKTYSYVLVFGHFIFPFFFFMSKHVKRFLPTHFFVVILLIIMSYVDLYYVVMPSFSKEFSPHILDISTLLACLSIFITVVLKKLENLPLIPIKDPRLNESIHLESR